MNKLYTRVCSRCNEEYKTTSKMSEVCLDCSQQSGNKLKQKYFLLKAELDQIRHNATLEKWKVLSEAYKLGKQIWGKEFSVKRLSEDFQLPYATTKRCLSLDKATPTTWKLIRSGKISAFKAAAAIMSKDNRFQDETIDLIIKNDYSTSKIKKWNVKGEKDLILLKQRMCAEKGFSRKDTAYRSLHMWIERGCTLLLTKPEYFHKTKLPNLKKELESLRIRIDKFLLLLNEEKDI